MNPYFWSASRLYSFRKAKQVDILKSADSNKIGSRCLDLFILPYGFVCLQINTLQNGTCGAFVLCDNSVEAGTPFTNALSFTSPMSLVFPLRTVPVVLYTTDVPMLVTFKSHSSGTAHLTS